MIHSLVRVAKVGRFAVLAALIACAAAAIQPASAQTATTPAPAAPAAPAAAAQVPILLGILDTQALLNNSAAGKSLNTQLNAAMKVINDDMDKKESGLRSQAQALDQQRLANPPITPADYNAKMKALQAQDDQFQQAYGKSKQAIGQRLDRAREQIKAAAAKAVQDVAKQRNLTLVIERSAVHLFAPNWDITDDVMKRLNKALPNVKM